METLSLSNPSVYSVYLEEVKRFVRLKDYDSVKILASSIAPDLKRWIWEKLSPIEQDEILRLRCASLATPHEVNELVSHYWADQYLLGLVLVESHPQLTAQILKTMQQETCLDDWHHCGDAVKSYLKTL